MGKHMQHIVTVCVICVCVKPCSGCLENVGLLDSCREGVSGPEVFKRPCPTASLNALEEQEMVVLRAAVEEFDTDPRELAESHTRFSSWIA